MSDYFPIDGLNFIGDGEVRLGGTSPTASGVVSTNPAKPAQVIWQGAPNIDDVAGACAAAHEAQLQWASLDITEREAVLRTFQQLAKEREQQFADLICDETGKALWDAQAEAKLIAGKVDVTLDQSFPQAARHRVRGYTLNLTETRDAVCSFRPHGVMAVIGPFNFPAHLPNGHIIPALLMGNAVVFKPSEKTPAVGQLLAQTYRDALAAHSLPLGVVNLVHGSGDVAQQLVTNQHVDGVLFTGSWPVGRAILEANLDTPGRIVALELGGNNPAIVMPDADLAQAALECARAAFITTGQRCTCTRRTIVHDDVADEFVRMLKVAAGAVVVGEPRGRGGDANQPVFMGPLVTGQARDAALAAQARWQQQGAELIREAQPIETDSRGHYITPGIVAVDRFTLEKEHPGGDEEVFGPIVRVARAHSFEDALTQANATRYGLAASLFTQDENRSRVFLERIKAGCVNINTGTAGASGKLPFGGLGRSGNHRPAGAFSLDYCAFPVASLVERSPAAAASPGLGTDADALRA